MKPLDLEGLAGGRDLTPRRICRGLIEATATGPPRARASAPLPGESAGASLKLAPLVGGEEAPNRTPRRICRGLIEASIAPTRPSTSWPTTPRRICRGLIEARAGGVGATRSSSGTPRRICRGLIEAPTSRRRHRRPFATPRRICRGLIEASPRRSPPRLPGSTPRRICRGLIEAFLVPRLHAEAGRPLPGESAGASLKLSASACRG